MQIHSLSATNRLHMRRPNRSRIGSSKRGPAAGRRGVAAVEFAVCLPVLVLLVFGAIEASSFIFLKQSLNVAAYESIRESIRVGNDNASGVSRGTNILTSRSVNDFAISFPNGEAGDASRGDEIVVEVSAPTLTNSPLAGQFIPNRILTARVVMVKE
ncbi:TadE-like protein [Rubripirellula lacrimiformis]|uniref:TadE-like protein n=1 Tax=Rubripirellula lacrimiformis TaxID=1930273 RepID=A0A517NC03_9BACT|nr:TadE/TadG family type IV pilus assembly protein [Rubripirellula lacrimiformis]QDT04660.1 TadE-like protein [Rubripirellula lacrimiformis]